MKLVLDAANSVFDGIKFFKDQRKLMNEASRKSSVSLMSGDNSHGLMKVLFNFVGTIQQIKHADGSKGVKYLGPRTRLQSNKVS